MSDGTKVVRFTRTEKYKCEETVHYYREGDVHRFIDDFAGKWLQLQAAELAEGDFADLELTPRPEPHVPGVPVASAPSVFEKPRRKAAPVPVPEPEPVPAPVPVAPAVEPVVVPAPAP
ncbi:MAG: hypothetical protein V4564_07835 [Pseudomonadota bacterium]